jgi:integrase
VNGFFVIIQIHSTTYSIKCRYDPEQKTIRFPAQKKEENDRIIPAHPEIAKSLDYWLNNRKSKSSVSGRFTAFKSALGYGPETDFHSFRRTFIAELENIECPEAITADIVGHKKQTITYGTYSGGSKIELMRKWLDKLYYS